MDGPDRRVLVDGIDIRNLVPAARVPGAVFTAMRPERILLGVLVVLFLVAVGRAWDATIEPRMPMAVLAGMPVMESGDEPELVGDFESLTQGLRLGLGEIMNGVVSFDGQGLGQGVVTLAYRLPAAFWEFSRPFVVIYGIVVVFALGIVGAAVARLEAERFGPDREATVMAALSWSSLHWQRLVGSVLLPPVLALILLIVPGVLGAIALVPVLNVIVAILWGIGLLFAFASAVLVAAWLVSLPILIPAAACERGDPGEVVVRTAGLAWRRPFSLLLLMFVAVISGVLGWLLVSGLLVVTLDASRAAGTMFGTPSLQALSTTTWPSLESIPNAEAQEVQGTTWLAFAINDLWRTFVISIGFGWLVVYVMSAGARVYLLQRLAVEGLDIEELGEPGPIG